MKKSMFRELHLNLVTENELATMADEALEITTKEEEKVNKKKEEKGKKNGRKFSL